MSDDVKNMKFEKGLEELERIVTELESGELTLDEVLKRYEQGVKVSRLLQGKLQEATQKIEVLTKDLEGKLEVRPLEPGAGEKRSSRKKGSPETGGGDLLI